mmetsp:Transcript_10816/g.32033  ORF Transcript_10816/g.32033 Transcript_10816/m.32033 type:complete len:254 (+) Transcript_10816:490-1251(+)
MWWRGKVLSKSRSMVSIVALGLGASKAAAPMASSAPASASSYSTPELLRTNSSYIPLCSILILLGTSPMRAHALPRRLWGTPFRARDLTFFPPPRLLFRLDGGRAPRSIMAVHLPSRRAPALDVGLSSPLDLPFLDLSVGGGERGGSAPAPPSPSASATGRLSSSRLSMKPNLSSFLGALGAFSFFFFSAEATARAEAAAAAVTAGAGDLPSASPSCLPPRNLDTVASCSARRASISCFGLGNFSCAATARGG